MSIFQSLFGGANVQQTQQQQQQPTNQPDATQNPTFPSQQQQMNGQPPAGADPAKQETNPLDAYSKIFEPAPPADPANQEPSTAVIFNQQEVATKLQGMDFMKFVDQKDVQAISQGGEGAVSAMGNMMNAMMRQAMLMNTAFAANSANRAAEFALTKSTSALPEMVRGQLTQQEFSDPAMNHPALQPMVKALTTQFQTQFPKASPQEVATHVKTYLGTVGKMFVPQGDPATQQQNTPTQQATQDWGTYFTQ